MTNDLLPPGIGLRAPHFRAIEAARPSGLWLEVHAENFLHQGPALSRLKSLRRDYALSLHGVGLSLGSAKGIDKAHAQAFAKLARETEPFLVSDHLWWSTIDGVYLNDLLDRKSTRLNSSHVSESRMPSSA